MESSIDKAQIKKQLIKSIDRITEKIEELKELTKPISPENAIGRISRMDAINNKTINEAALSKAQEKLKKMQFAIKGLDDPDFGICSKCGYPIQMQRIILMPESVNCVRCAR